MFKKFRLPTPKELGKSSINALEMRCISPLTKSYTWEDHYDYLKKNYPIRYFLFEELPRFLRRAYRPVNDAWWWLKYHCIPKHRHHFLDLRQPYGNSIDEYYYGWADLDQRMLYANFNLLKLYFENEQPCNLRDSWSQEEIDADPALLSQQRSYDEAKAILNWWQVERKENAKIIDNLYDDWRKTKFSNDQSEIERCWKLWRDAEEKLEEKTEEMLVRLIKIRRSLWT